MAWKDNGTKLLCDPGTRDNGQIIQALHGLFQVPESKSEVLAWKKLGASFCLHDVVENLGVIKCSWHYLASLIRVRISC